MSSEIKKLVSSKIKNRSLKSQLKLAPHLLQHCQIKTLKTDQTLFVQRESAEHAFLVLRGCVRIFARSTHFEKTLTIISEGELGGALLLTNPVKSYYPGSVIALVDSLVLLIPKSTYLNYWIQNPITNNFINTCVYERIQKIQEERIFANANVEVRLARFLVYHLLTKKDLCGRKITRRQIALSIGTKPATVIRMIRKFELEGILTAKSSTYTVLAEVELKKKAHQ